MVCCCGLFTVYLLTWQIFVSDVGDGDVSIFIEVVAFLYCCLHFLLWKGMRGKEISTSSLKDGGFFGVCLKFSVDSAQGWQKELFKMAYGKALHVQPGKSAEMELSAVAVAQSLPPQRRQLWSSQQWQSLSHFLLNADSYGALNGGSRSVTSSSTPTAMELSTVTVAQSLPPQRRQLWSSHQWQSFSHFLLNADSYGALSSDSRSVTSSSTQTAMELSAVTVAQTFPPQRRQLAYRTTPICKQGRKLILYPWHFGGFFIF